MDLSPIEVPATLLVFGCFAATVLTVNKVFEGFSSWLEAWKEVREPRPFMDGFYDVLNPKQFQLEHGDPETLKHTGYYTLIHIHDVLGYTVEKGDNLVVEVTVDTKMAEIQRYTLVETGAQDFLNWIGNTRYSSNP